MRTEEEITNEVKNLKEISNKFAGMYMTTGDMSHFSKMLSCISALAFVSWLNGNTEEQLSEICLSTTMQADLGIFIDRRIIE